MDLMPAHNNHNHSFDYLDLDPDLCHAYFELDTDLSLIDAIFRRCSKLLRRGPNPIFQPIFPHEDDPIPFFDLTELNKILAVSYDEEVLPVGGENTPHKASCLLLNTNLVGVRRLRVAAMERLAAEQKARDATKVTVDEVGVEARQLCRPAVSYAEVKKASDLVHLWENPFDIFIRLIEETIFPPFKWESTRDDGADIPIESECTNMKPERVNVFRYAKRLHDRPAYDEAARRRVGLIL